jgi:hypothetical protein
MIIFFAAMVFMYDYVTLPLINMSKEVEANLNIFEAFIAMGNSGLSLFILPLIFFALISDYPQLEKHTLFSVVRVGKTSWLISQFVNLFFMVSSFILSILIISTFPLLISGNFDFQWSFVTKEYIQIDFKNAETFEAMLIPENLYHHLTLVTALLHTMMFLLLYLFSIGLTLIVGKLSNLKLFGMLATGILVGFGMIFSAIGSELMWLFPTANATVSLHFTQFLREPIVPLIHSYLYFGVFIIIFMAISVILIKKTSFSDMEW